jgi:hypothetical protein
MGTEVRPELPSFLRRASHQRGGARVVAANGASARQAIANSPAERGQNEELRAERDRLLEKFTIMQADLGGAFYEMAIRDHVRLDVLTRKAAELQRVDLELQEAERTLELERADAAGLCVSCGAPYGYGVRFCSQCGNSLAPPQAVP